MSILDRLSDGDRESYEEVFEQFTQVPNGLPLFLDLELSYFLAFLVNWWRLKSDPRYNGWFYCPSGVIKRHLRLERTKQWRLLDKLYKLDLIKYGNADHGPVHASGDKKRRRWIFIRFSVIREKIREARLKVMRETGD